MQTLAGPDQVVIAASTQRLTAGSFEYEDLGEHTLSGIGEPLRVWRVVGESRAQRSFRGCARPGARRRSIGRETEITMLRNKWAQAREGEGQAVLLYGQPGMGKSRITQELCERVAKEPHWLLRYQCSQYYSNSAFYCILADFAAHGRIRAHRFDRDQASPSSKRRSPGRRAHGSGSRRCTPRSCRCRWIAFRRSA